MNKVFRLTLQSETG